jgi:hypothetical protein
MHAAPSACHLIPLTSDDLRNASVSWLDITITTNMSTARQSVSTLDSVCAEQLLKAHKQAAAVASKHGIAVITTASCERAPIHHMLLLLYNIKSRSREIYTHTSYAKVYVPYLM